MIVSMGKKNNPATSAPAVAESLNQTTKPAAGISALVSKPVAAVPATADGNGAAAAKKKPAKAAPRRKPVGFSSEDIAMRAYFISENRHRNRLHGDEQSDWIEAERQLRAEHRKKAAKKVTRSRKRA